MLMVGFKAAEEARGIYSVNKKGDVTELAKPIGRLDGLYQMSDGTILATDWNSGSLFSWTAERHENPGVELQGPRRPLRLSQRQGLMVVVPDLAKSEVRLISTGRVGEPWLAVAGPRLSEPDNSADRLSRPRLLQVGLPGSPGEPRAG
jgi:hypothetical protein